LREKDVGKMATKNQVAESHPAAIAAKFAR
jgi:hypothetical protein